MKCLLNINCIIICFEKNSAESSIKNFFYLNNCILYIFSICLKLMGIGATNYLCQSIIYLFFSNYCSVFFVYINVSIWKKIECDIYIFKFKKSFILQTEIFSHRSDTICMNVHALTMNYLYNLYWNKFRFTWIFI